MRRIAFLFVVAGLCLFVVTPAFGASPVVTDVQIERGRDTDAPDWASYHQHLVVTVSDADGAGDIASVTITDTAGVPHTVTPSGGGGWWGVDPTTIACDWFEEDLTAPPPAGSYTIVAADAASNEGSLITPAAPAVSETYPTPLAAAPDSVITETAPTFQWEGGLTGSTHIIAVQQESAVAAIWSADVGGATQAEYDFDGSASQAALEPNHTYLWTLHSSRPEDDRVTDARVSIWTTQRTRSRFAVYGAWADTPPDLPGKLAYTTCLWAEDGYEWASSTTSVLAHDADAHTRQWLGPIGADYPDWSPDGSKLLYAKGRGLWVDSLDGTPAAQIPGVAGGDCRWASDSLRVVYTAAGPPSSYTPYPPWNSDVWVTNIDGTDSYPIADSIYHDERWPAWSPDGLWVAYRKLPAAEGSSLWLIRYDRADDHPLIATGVDGYPDYDVHYMGEHAWSPDGTRLAVNFAATDGVNELSGIGVVSRDGGLLAPVFISPAEAICCTGVHLPEWSPDGAQIVFTSGHHLSVHTGPGVWSSDGEVYLANADGSGEPIRLTYDHSFSFYVSWWAPNTDAGEDVAVTKGDTTVTFDEVTTTGNTSVTVYEDPVGLPTNFAFCQDEYQITTTAEIVGPITICMQYDEADIPTGSSEEDLCLLHYVEDGDYWEDITVSRDPEGNMLCGQCTFLSVFTLGLAPSARFPDVPGYGLGEHGTDPYWAFDEIEACAEAGIVAGYPDGTYQPASAVTRDQMAVYIARALAGGDEYVPEFAGAPSFPDVGEEHWALDYVEYAAKQSVVEGYGDGTYHPRYEVSRAQMAVYIARARGWVSVDDDMTAAPEVFPDVPAGYWAGTAVQACADNGVVQGYRDGSYHPDEVVTRDQMAVYVARAFELTG